MGRIKGLLSQHVYSKKESWKTALSLTEKRLKAPWIKKKELLTLTPVTMQMGEDEDNDDDDE